MGVSQNIMEPVSSSPSCSCMHNRPAVFITQLTFFCFLTLLDSVGNVSLLHIFGWWELSLCCWLPTGSLDTERYHRSCWQLWLHSFWLRHQELHWQENSRVRDASISHKGRGLTTANYYTYLLILHSTTNSTYPCTWNKKEMDLIKYSILSSFPGCWVGRLESLNTKLNNYPFFFLSFV